MPLRPDSVIFPRTQMFAENASSWPLTMSLQSDPCLSLHCRLVVLTCCSQLPAWKVSKCSSAGMTRFSVVLLDVCMPGLNGMETCKRLCELDAGMPVCFMTGYNSDEIRVQLSKLHVPVLQKPFNLSALLAVLNGLINARTLVHAD
jgi:CheY-like chemotaxis protein